MSQVQQELVRKISHGPGSLRDQLRTRVAALSLCVRAGRVPNSDSRHTGTSVLLLPSALSSWPVPWPAGSWPQGLVDEVAVTLGCTKTGRTTWSTQMGLDSEMRASCGIGLFHPNSQAKAGLHLGSLSNPSRIFHLLSAQQLPPCFTSACFSVPPNVVSPRV